jgi:glycogen synthase
MTILQIGGGWFPETAGGLERYYRELVLALLEKRPGSVTGLVTGSSLCETETGGRIRSFGPPDLLVPRRMWRTRMMLSAMVGARRPTLAAVHFALHAFPGLDRLQHLPLVVHFHGPWTAESAVECNHPLTLAAKRGIEMLVYTRAERFIVLSEAFARVLVESYHADPARIQVIPGGVDTGRFRITHSKAAARLKLGWPADRLVLLTVRRLVSRMGLETLIEAMRPIVERHKDALLMIAGTGPLAEHLRSLVTLRGLERHVSFLGFVDDALLPLAYRAADVTVLPSEKLEGFGLSAVESLAAGTPCVVTPIGGLPEAVSPLCRALVTRDTSADSLADTLDAVLSNTLTLPSVDQCQAYAELRFSWQTVLPRIIDVYEQAGLTPGWLRNSPPSAHPYTNL